MTEEEKAKKIEEIYNEAADKFAKLGAKRKEVIGDYIKELEVQKAGAIRAALDLSFNKQ